MRIILLSATILLSASLLSAQNYKVTELSLQECVQMAIDRNINVQSTRIDREKSGHKVSETRATLLPKININGNFTDHIEKSVTLLPGEIVGRPGTNIAAEMGTQFNTSAGISINQVLYNQTALTALKLSKKMENLSGLNIEKASEELAVEVSKLYFLALTTAKQKNLVEENISRTKRLSDIVKILVDNGMGKEVDYQRISVSLENLHTHLSNAEAALEQQLNMIRYMLVIPIEENIILTDTAEMPLLSQFSIMKSDFSDHIDIQLLESQKEINQLNQKMITAGYFPTLSFVGQYAYQGYREEFKNYFQNSPENKWYSSSYIGVSLSIPVFDSFEKRSKSRQAKLDYQKTELRIDDTKERFSVNYQNAINSYQNHKTNVERQKKNIELAEKVYQETALKYREGLASMSDALQDEMSLSNAQSAYLSALYNYKEAELKIMSLTGEVRNLIKN